MELLYVWIEDHNCIKNQGFNFSPRYEFSFEPIYNGQVIISGNLTKKDLTPTTEDNFFGEHITDISAIVGKNGTGKSSLIEAIFSFATHKNPDFNIIKILVFKNESSDFFVYVPWHTNIEIKFPYKEKRYAIKQPEEDLNEHLQHTSFIYLNHSIFTSNFDIPFPLEDGERSIDISTATLWKEYGFDGCMNREIYQQLTQFKDEYFSKHYEDLKIEIPTKLKISLSDSKIKMEVYKKNEYDNQSDNKKSNPIRLKTIAEFFDAELSKGNNLSFSFIKEEEKPSFFERAFLISSFYFLFEHRMLDKEITETVFLDLMNAQDKKNIYQLIYDCLEQIKQKITAKNKRTDCQLNFINQVVVKFLTDIQDIDKYTKDNQIEQNFLINLIDDNYNNRTLIEKLLTFFSFMDGSRFLKESPDKYDKAIFPHNYIKLSWSKFSSGEQMMLNTLSRLNHIRNMKDKVIDQDIILLIDEGELYLHPQWQKRYINDLINLLDFVFKGKKTQIILTSHSPFIISDLPKENVIFLDKDKDSGYCKVDSGIEKQQTFGANIHTLFADTFFFEDGLMGNFAKQKINNVIKDLKANKPTQAQIEHAEKIIDLIGEPVLRMKMLQLLNSVKNNRA